MRKHRIYKSSLCFLLLFIVMFFIFYLTTKNERNSRPVKADGDSKRSSTYDTLLKFSYLIPRDVRLCLLEPTLLHDMLSQKKKELLKRKGFQLSTYNGANNVISVAIFSSDLLRLKSANLLTKLKEKNFKLWDVESTRSKSRQKSYVTHQFYTSGRNVIHMIIFYEKRTYFWHGKLDVFSGEFLQLFTFENLLYVENESIYERFELQPLFKNKTYSNLYIPSSIPEFLLQISTSSLVHCQKQPTANSLRNETKPNQVPIVVFEETAKAVMIELKSVFRQQLSEFWISSGTLLGWYRDCGLIPYTSDIDFAAWAKDLEVELIMNLRSNSNIKFLTGLGKVESDLEFWLLYKWLRVDLFFTYEDNETNHYWTGGHRPEYGYTFKYVFPKFSLCSGLLLNCKILVPCSPEDIIEAEYGKNWRKPTSDWNYDLSARNVLGRRYWDSKERNRLTRNVK